MPPDSTLPPVTISGLPQASQAHVEDQLEVNQSGTTRSITVGQIGTMVFELLGTGGYLPLTGGTLSGPLGIGRPPTALLDVVGTSVSDSAVVFANLDNGFLGSAQVIRQELGTSLSVSRRLINTFGVGVLHEFGAGVLARTSDFDGHTFRNSAGTLNQLAIQNRQVTFYGATSGLTKVQAQAAAPDITLTLPASTGTLALISDVSSGYLPLTGGTLSGPLGIGTAPLADYALRVSLPMSSDVATAIGVTSEIQPTTTAVAFIYRSKPSFNATPFSISSLIHFDAQSPTIGGATLDQQYGFYAESGLTGAAFNYGFYSAILAGTERWNFFAGGTANNAFAGKTRFGGTLAPVATVDVTGTLAVSTPIAATSGGTGQSVYAVGDILYANTTTTLAKLADIATGNVLISGGVGVAPSWSKVQLQTNTHIQGILGVGNGGTGQNSFAIGDLLSANASNTLARLADVATGNALISGGVGVMPSWGKIALTTHVSGVLPPANGGSGSSTVFTQGSITFAGASGVATEDNANFFWDNTNKRLGIGTASPGGAVDVVSTLTGGSVPALNIQQTWNNAATGFSALLVNAINTNSAAASYLANFQVGGASFVTISKTGSINMVGSLSVAGAQLMYWAARSIMSSPVDGQIRLTNQAQTDFTRLQFGGTTNAFPALRRTAAALNVRLADDSADADLTAGAITTNGLTVGYLEIPQNIQAANYTTVLADAGKHLYHAVAAAAATYTIPANATVAYPIGTTLTMVNDSVNSVTIAITTDTLVWSPGTTTGSRTLSTGGMATAMKVTATRWLINGTGLT